MQLKGNSFSGGLNLLEADTQGFGIYLESVFYSDFRSNFPYAFGQPFVGFGFSGQTDFVAYSNPHAGFAIVTDIDGKGINFHRLKGYSKLKLLTNFAA
jgi:hypothetical protein